MINKHILKSKQVAKCEICRKVLNFCHMYLGQPWLRGKEVVSKDSDRSFDSHAVQWLK